MLSQMRSQLDLLLFQLLDHAPEEIGDRPRHHIKGSGGKAEQACVHQLISGQIERQIDVQTLEKLKGISDKKRKPCFLGKEDAGRLWVEIGNPCDLDPVKS